MTGTGHRIANTALALTLPYHTVLPWLQLPYSYGYCACVALGIVLSARWPDTLEMRILPHRKVTHFIILPLILGFVAYRYTVVLPIVELFLIGVALGYMAHIICDAMDYGGIPLTPFGPTVKLGLYKTSGSFMFLGVLLWVILCGLQFYIFELPRYL